MDILSDFCFKSQQLFEELPQNIKNDFKRQLIVKKYKKNQYIYTEGTFPAGMYLIINGLSKRVKNLNGNNEQIIYIYSKGELMGYASLIANEIYSDSVVAITEMEVGFLTVDNLIDLKRKYNDFSDMMMKNLGHEFIVLSNMITIYSSKTVRERLALILLLLYEKFKKINENTDNSIFISRNDIANYAGTAVETVVRLLKEFKTEQIIDFNGKKIIILNHQKLLSLVGI